MLFRVYDNEKKTWVKKNVYLNTDGELFLIKHFLFGMIKVPLILSSDRYIYHQDIGLYDKDNKLIYEGDYLKAQVAEDKTMVGLVVFAHELSSYVILCVDQNEFYMLGSDVSAELQIIGNVFDGYEK